MKKFNPPIEERDTDELIIIGSCSNGDWQDEAIESANHELRKRKVSREEQKEIYDGIRAIEKQFFQEEMERRAVEEMHLLEIIIHLIFWPYLIFNNWSWRKNGYLKKANQRLIFIGLGFFLMVGYVAIDSQLPYHEEEKQKKLDAIKNTDISDWEENRYTEEEMKAMDDSVRNANN